jgi:hypothetical protein
MDFFGKSGNSNPHFAEDWLNVEIDDNDKFAEGEWNDQL